MIIIEYRMNSSVDLKRFYPYQILLNSQKYTVHGIKIFIKIPFFVSEVFVDLTGPSLKLEEGIFIWSAVADKLTS